MIETIPEGIATFESCEMMTLTNRQKCQFPSFNVDKSYKVMLKKKVCLFLYVLMYLTDMYLLMENIQQTKNNYKFNRVLIPKLVLLRRANRTVSGRILANRC